MCIAAQASVSHIGSDMSAPWCDVVTDVFVASTLGSHIGTDIALARSDVGADISPSLHIATDIGKRSTDIAVSPCAALESAASELWGLYGRKLIRPQDPPLKTRIPGTMLR